MSDIDRLRSDHLRAVSEARTEADLEQARLRALGRKGEVSQRLRALGGMEPEQRRLTAPALNRLKSDLNKAIALRKRELIEQALDAQIESEVVDVTLPGRPRRQGSVHPVSQTIEEVSAIFADMGFGIAEGPEIETDWHNFDALNIRPARNTTRSSFEAASGNGIAPTSCARIRRRFRSGR